MSEDVPKSKPMAGPAMSGLQRIAAGGIMARFARLERASCCGMHSEGKPVGSLRPRSSGIKADENKVRFAPNVECGEGFLRPVECA